MDEMQKMIDYLERCVSDINGYECDFIESIKERIEDGKELTEKQVETLTDIYKRVTSI